MGSWTDKTPTFNPYVQQLPVEAMVSVGMAKQKRYDEGVQKIQTSIDNVAGIDIVHESDKEYLRTKMNNLGGKLKTLAAGDFSNYQLVNSVTGMTKNIIKDENIQNAMQSTAHYKKQAALIQKDEADGKSNPYNTRDFSKKANAWLSNKETGQKFTASYFKPIDVWKKITDIATSVGVDSDTIPNLFKTDEKGNYILKDGKPEYNMIAVEKMVEGKGADKLLNAFKLGLTPGDYEQLAINGRGQFEGLTPEVLAEKINTDSKRQIDFTNEKLLDLKTDLISEESKKVDDRDEEAINSLKKQIEYFEASSEQIKTSTINNLSLLSKDPDAIRASLYTNSYLSSMSQVLSTKKSSIKYSENVGWNAIMKLNEFNYKIRRDRVQDSQWQLTHNLAVKKQAFEEKKTKDENGDPTNPYNYFDAPLSPDDIQDLKVVNEENFNQNIGVLNTKNYDLTLAYFKEANKDKMLPGETADEFTERMKRAISSYSKTNKESINSNSGEVNSFTSRFASKMLNLWSVNPENIPQKSRGLVASQAGLKKEIELQAEEIKMVKEEAKKRAIEKDISIIDENDIKKIKPVTIVLNNERINLSNRDLMDFAAMMPDEGNILEVFISKEEKQRAAIALERQVLKYGNAEKVKQITQFLRYTPSAFYENPPSYKDFGRIRAFADKDSSIKAAIDLTYNAKYQNLSKLESEIYKEKGIMYKKVATALQVGKGKEVDVASRVSAVIANYPVAAEKGVTETEIQKALLETGNHAIRFDIVTDVSGQQVYDMILTSKDGEKFPLRINKTEYESINQKPAPEAVVIPRSLKRVNLFGTTNSNKVEDPTTAYFNSADFTNLQNSNFKYKGDYFQDDDDSNKLWLTLYQFDKKGNYIKTFTLNQPFYKQNQFLDSAPRFLTEADVKILTK